MDRWMDGWMDGCKHGKITHKHLKRFSTCKQVLLQNNNEDNIS